MVAGLAINHFTNEMCCFGVDISIRHPVPDVARWFTSFGLRTTSSCPATTTCTASTRQCPTRQFFQLELRPGVRDLGPLVVGQWLLTFDRRFSSAVKTVRPRHVVAVVKIVTIRRFFQLVWKLGNLGTWSRPSSIASDSSDRSSSANGKSHDDNVHRCWARPMRPSIYSSGTDTAVRGIGQRQPVLADTRQCFLWEQLVLSSTSCGASVAMAWRINIRLRGKVGITGLGQVSTVIRIRWFGWRENLLSVSCTTSTSCVAVGVDTAASQRDILRQVLSL